MTRSAGSLWSHRKSADRNQIAELVDTIRKPGCLPSTSGHFPTGVFGSIKPRRSFKRISQKVTAATSRPSPPSIRASSILRRADAGNCPWPSSHQYSAWESITISPSRRRSRLPNPQAPPEPEAPLPSSWSRLSPDPPGIPPAAPPLSRFSESVALPAPPDHGPSRSAAPRSVPPLGNTPASSPSTFPSTQSRQEYDYRRDYSQKESPTCRQMSHVL